MDKKRYRAHYGGSCPVHYKTVVEVIFRDGDRSSLLSAGSWEYGTDYWKWEGPSHCNIVAYRLVDRK